MKQFLVYFVGSAIAVFLFLAILASGLLAAANSRNHPWQSPEVLWPAGIAVGLTILGLALLIWVISQEEEELLDPGVYLVDIESKTELRYDPSLKTMLPYTTKENTFSKIAELTDDIRIRPKQ